VVLGLIGVTQKEKCAIRFLPTPQVTGGQGVHWRIGRKMLLNDANAES
jgi:hypothetical protein